MSAALSYAKSFVAIKNACQANLSFIDSVVKQCQGFISSNQTFLKSLSKITPDLPSKRVQGMRIFSNAVKGPNEFKHSETTFIRTFTEISNKAFSGPPGLSFEVDVFATKFVDLLVNARKQYKQQVSNMIEMGDLVVEMFDKAQAEFDKAQAKYDAVCKEYEVLSSKPNDEPKAIAKFNATAQAKIDSERQLAQLMQNLNNTRYDWASCMEDVLTKFEILDKKLNVVISDIFINFSPNIEDIRRMREDAISFLTNVIDQDTLTKELHQATDEENFEESKIVKIDPTFKPIQFDISPVLTENAFEGEDSKILTTVIEDYQAVKVDEISLHEGEVALIQFSQDGRHFVSTPTNSGFVPVDKLKALCCTFTPHISQMKSDYAGPPSLMKNDYIFVRSVFDGKAYISTVSYEDIIIPADLIK